MPVISALNAAREAIRPLYRAPEREILQDLAHLARLSPTERGQVVGVAGGLLSELRAPGRAGWIDRFLQEYSLSSEEGAALLGLAEAYLRVPDAETANALIRDKLGQGDWRAHAGGASSVLVNSATLGLILAQSMTDATAQAGTLRSVVARLGEPAIRVGVTGAMQRMGEAFVLGRDITEALRRADRGANKAFRYSFDMLGEGARTAEDAEDYQESYRRAVKAVGQSASTSSDVFARDSVSVKLSALHPRYEPLQSARAVRDLTGRLIELACLAKAGGVGLTIDAEESDRLEMSLDIIAAAAADSSLSGWDGLGMAVQAYQRRAGAVIAWAGELGRSTGRRLMVRLVKGAYWDSEIKRAQERGLSDYPVFTRKSGTDVSYMACARALLDTPSLFPAFATHNALTVATVLQWAGGRRDFEFQRLHGMGEGLYEGLMERQGVAVRIYAPVGGYRDLLAYLVRRLLENGANTSFVHQIADKTIRDEDLLADPVEQAQRTRFSAHPAIRLPGDMFGSERRNSIGTDLSDPPSVAALMAGIAAGAPRGEALAAASADTVVQAVMVADRAQRAWDATPVEVRAAALDRLADLIERDRAGLIALLTDEAGKTLGDGLGEVREAIDFCRYYAAQARKGLQPLLLPGPTGETNELSMAGRGVFACISPWNFPLAIFIGQVAAALVTGNTVVAKPAPQTPRIALAAIALAHEAGIPADVLVLVTGGADVGAALVGNALVKGVAFTGSTASARRIARSLLEDENRPLIPLIAETGGINAMIVDSTVLPEQVVGDVVTSAFLSAGQRCSALRLLCLHEDIADQTLRMLYGAMAELIIGDPADPVTDVGPVIDAAAKAAHDAHLARWASRINFACDPPATTKGRAFTAPTVIRLDRVSDLDREVFGPILHVVTWKATGLNDLVGAIMAQGYGLTLGVHSRIGAVAQSVRAAAKVGNLYVNRSMIGAVVGVQPFGGEGLSGTGPKAGGPHYLPRFAVERTYTVDTTSAGGNASLLSLDEDQKG